MARVKKSIALRKCPKIINLVRSLNILVIDIHDKVFKSHPQPSALFPFQLRRHYNPERYRLIAKTIVAGIKNAKNY
jgi:hypothetical protein